MQPPPLRWAVAPLVFSRKARNAFRAYGVLPVLRHFLGRLSRHGLRAAVSPPQVPPPEGNPRGTYQDWIGRYDRWTAADRRRTRREMDAFPRHPELAFVMPLAAGDTSAALEAVLAAFRNQCYPHWELHLVVDGSNPEALARQAIAAVMPGDRRLHCHVLPGATSPGDALVEGLARAGGEWVACWNPCWLPAERALFEIARHVLAAPEAQMLFSDHDERTDEGLRRNPVFEPEWDEMRFCARGAESPFLFRRSLVAAVGGLRPEYGEAAVDDLVLRASETVAPSAIHHLPRLLMHRRAAASADATRPPEAHRTEGARCALREHLRRTGADAEVGEAADGCPIRYRLPERPPRVSILIPVRNGQALFKTCIESIRSRTTYPDYEILVIDNGSDEPAMLDYLRGLGTEPRLRILRDPRPFNYSALNNAAAAAASGEVLALLNSDIEVRSPGWLEELVALALLPGTGAVGACLWYPDDTLQHGGVVLGIKGVAAHAPRRLRRDERQAHPRVFCRRTVSAVTGACLVVRRDRYAQAGGLNAAALAVAFNDIDFCLRLKQSGYRNLWTPLAELYHHESASRGREDTPGKQRRFAGEIEYMLAQWGERLRRDPAYNPNLTLEDESFGLAWPPRLPPFE